MDWMDGKRNAEGFTAADGGVITSPCAPDSLLNSVLITTALLLYAVTIQNVKMI